jgi:5-formyltetrahydrofolate cyclo-ligase
MESKVDLRKRFLADRNLLTRREARERAAAIGNNLLERFSFESQKILHCYLPAKYGREVDTLEIIDKLNRKFEDISILVPFFKGNSNNEIYAAKFDGHDILKYNHLNIPQPLNYLKTFNPKRVGAIIVPLISFDLYGNRLGFGGGYYDKLINLLRPDCIKIGLGYELSLYNKGKLPNDKHDKQLDYVITEKKVYDFR